MSSRRLSHAAAIAGFCSVALLAVGVGRAAPPANVAASLLSARTMSANPAGPRRFRLLEPTNVVAHERLRLVVLGVSPTHTPPSSLPGIAVLGAIHDNLPRFGPRKSAWMDYVSTPLAPAWSLRWRSAGAFTIDAAGVQKVGIQLTGDNDISPSGFSLTTTGEAATPSSAAPAPRATAGLFNLGTSAASALTSEGASLTGPTTSAGDGEPATPRPIAGGAYGAIVAPVGSDP